MSEYRVTLDAYNGPLDLLLFLIRRDEIDIYDIPISRITAQYVEYVEALEKLDPEAAGEFLVLAATLIEIKSRTLLPKPPIEEDEEELLDPRSELVRQLLEYKKFKDAAYSLEDAAEERANRFERRPALPVSDPSEIELDNVEVWDLFEAFNRILDQIGKKSAVHTVSKDDTPMALHAADILDVLQRGDGSEEFIAVFAGRNRAQMVGLFLALLELIRQHRVRARQDGAMGPILLVLLDPTPLDEALTHVGNGSGGTEGPFDAEVPLADPPSTDDQAASDEGAPDALTDEAIEQEETNHDTESTARPDED